MSTSYECLFWVNFSPSSGHIKSACACITRIEVTWKSSAFSPKGVEEGDAVRRWFPLQSKVAGYMSHQLVRSSTSWQPEYLRLGMPKHH